MAKRKRNESGEPDAKEESKKARQSTSRAPETVSLTELLKRSRDAVALTRAEAVKLLSQLIDSNQKMNITDKLRKAVQERLVDASAHVRCAAFELAGKCIGVKPKMLDTFFALLVDRLRDPAISVRKQAITTLCDIAKASTTTSVRRDEIFALVLQRIDDEPSVQKLCIETFNSLWFNLLRPNARNELESKARSLANVTSLCAREGKLALLEQLFEGILADHSGDKQVAATGGQVVDALCNHLLELDTQLSKAGSIEDDLEAEGTRMSLFPLSAPEVDGQHGEFLSTLECLHLLAKVVPKLLACQVQFLLSYAKASARTTFEVRVLCRIISILELVVPTMRAPPGVFLAELDQRLCNVITNCGMKAIGMAVRCLKVVLECPNGLNPSKSKIAGPFLDQFHYLTRLRELLDQDPSFQLETAQVKESGMRCLFTLGMLLRYFDFDALLHSSDDPQILAEYERLNESDCSLEPRIAERRRRSDESGESRPPQLLREYVFACLLYFAECNRLDFSLKAITALGRMVVGWMEFASDPELNHLYYRILNDKSEERDELRVEVMKNLTSCIIAQAESERRLNEKIRAERAWGMSPIALKAMDSGGRGPSELVSRVINMHWPVIVSCYSPSSSERVREAASQLAWQVLNDGLVPPASAIPVLMEMSKDPVESIKERMEAQYDEVIRRYPGILAAVKSKENAYDYEVDIARYGETD